MSRLQAILIDETLSIGHKHVWDKASAKLVRELAGGEVVVEGRHSDQDLAHLFAPTRLLLWGPILSGGSTLDIIIGYSSALAAQTFSEN